MARRIGAVLGVFAFGTTCFLGLVAGNPIETTLTRAIKALFAFFALGLAVGWIANRVVEEYTASEHRQLFSEVEKIETQLKALEAENEEAEADELSPQSPALEA